MKMFDLKAALRSRGVEMRRTDRKEDLINTLRSMVASRGGSSASGGGGSGGRSGFGSRLRAGGSASARAWPKVRHPGVGPGTGSKVGIVELSDSDDSDKRGNRRRGSSGRAGGETLCDWYFVCVCVFFKI